MRSVRLTANARALGSSQADGLKDHTHLLGGAAQIDGAGGALSRKADNVGNTFTGGIVSGARAETRPVNTAYHPRIHA